MENESVPVGERLQIQHIRELEFEELEIEEVEDHGSDSDHPHGRNHGHRGAAPGEVTFDPCLASLHTYLGEVEDTQRRVVFLDTGALSSLPLIFLEGVVLFPEATLPLRVIQPNFINAVRRALDQVDAPNTIGVVHAYRETEYGSLRFSRIGTTAEIQQYRILEDGSLNVVCRGRQRFNLVRRWIDVELTTFAEVLIIQEDLPLSAPRDAFGKLPPPTGNVWGHGSGHTQHENGSHSNQASYGDEDNDSETISDEGFESVLSSSEKQLHQYALQSRCRYDIFDESTNSDEDKFVCTSSALSSPDFGKINKRKSRNAERWTSSWKVGKSKHYQSVSRAFWPYWVYQMYDSYCLAERAAEMWKKIVGAPSMDGLVKKPDLLSFYIASKIPLSVSTRQELLEINGISYRLRREIELLEHFDHIQCKSCQNAIARRSDMMVMSSDGPLGAYVNSNGFVHEIMTVYNATGIALMGSATEEYSWFPGYLWTIANCLICESQMGWLFTAKNRKLKPKSFWGIRSSQVADDAR